MVLQQLQRVQVTFQAHFVFVPVTAKFADLGRYVKLRSVQESKGKSIVDLTSIAIQVIVGVIIVWMILHTVGPPILGDR
jgi:hypothetical protein